MYSFVLFTYTHTLTHTHTHKTQVPQLSGERNNVKISENAERFDKYHYKKDKFFFIMIEFLKIKNTNWSEYLIDF